MLLPLLHRLTCTCMIRKVAVVRWCSSKYYSSLNNLICFSSLPKFNHPSIRHQSRFVEQGQYIHGEPPWKILFFGTDEFALPHLDALNKNRLLPKGAQRVVDSIEVVLASKAKCAVQSYAENNNLVYHRWPIPTIHNTYDVGVVTSFGRLIPQRVINMFPFGILNVHPSLLPRWRGASPILHTILNGDTITGITIIEIRPVHFDTGPVLLQNTYAIPRRCTAFQLRDWLSQEGARLLLGVLANLPSLERQEHEQPDDGVTYAHKLELANARINWEMQTVAEIDRQYRALGEIYDLRSEWKGAPVRLLGMVDPEQMAGGGILNTLGKKFPEDSVCVRPGLPYFHRPSMTLCIRCLDGWVGFKEVVLKKPISALNFYNGYLSRYRNTGVVFKSLPNELDQYTFRTTASQMKLVTATTTIA